MRPEGEEEEWAKIGDLSALGGRSSCSGTQQTSLVPTQLFPGLKETKDKEARK